MLSIYLDSLSIKTYLFCTRFDFTALLVFQNPIPQPIVSAFVTFWFTNSLWLYPTLPVPQTKSHTHTLTRPRTESHIYLMKWIYRRPPPRQAALDNVHVPTTKCKKRDRKQCADFMGCGAFCANTHTFILFTTENVCVCHDLCALCACLPDDGKSYIRTCLSFRTFHQAFWLLLVLGVRILWRQHSRMEWARARIRHSHQCIA